MRSNDQIVLTYGVLTSNLIIKVRPFETGKLKTSQATYMALVTVATVGKCNGSHIVLYTLYVTFCGWSHET